MLLLSAIAVVSNRLILLYFSNIDKLNCMYNIAEKCPHIFSYIELLSKQIWVFQTDVPLRNIKKYGKYA